MMKVIEEEQVRSILTPGTCIPLMRRALTELETGASGQPQRFISKMPNGAAFGFMPAFAGKDYFGAKILTAHEPNLVAGYPSHLGYVMLFESLHCTVSALVDATSITEIRTGAVSAVATDLLARKEAKSLALIGAGAQARSHTAALREIRPIDNITIFDIRKEKAEVYATETQTKYSIPVTICDTVEETVKDADIICTLTPSKEPFLYRAMVKKGVHINAVGTFTPTTREISSDLIADCRLYADQISAMKIESGEYLIPLQEGIIGEEHIIGSVGQLLLHQVQGRTHESDITVFDALGLAVEDIVASQYVFLQSSHI